LIGIPCLTCWALADAALLCADWRGRTLFRRNGPGLPSTSTRLGRWLGQAGAFTSMVNVGLMAMEKPLNLPRPNGNDPR
jgi:hypothetical protein